MAKVGRRIRRLSGPPLQGFHELAQARTLLSAGGMFSFTVRARHGTVLFATWAEARALWERLTDAFPSPDAMVIMPDHLHVADETSDPEPLVRAMRSYARWRNEHRGQRGRVWDPLEPPERLWDPLHAERTERYVHLNPCRARLVADPLAWPFSTHRDAVGLAIPAARRRADDPVLYQAYISGDPTVSVGGTDLPWACRDMSVPVDAVAAAVSSVMRLPTDAIRKRGPARTLLVAACRALTGLGTGSLARALDLNRDTVRVAESHEGEVALIARVARDPRFSSLTPGDLRRLPEWRRYRFRR